MRKYILLALLIAGILFFSFAVYNYSKEISSLSGSGSLNSLNLIKNKDINKTDSNKSYPETSKDTSKTSDSGAGSTGASGSGSGGSSGGDSGNGESRDSNYVPPEERRNESACILIRPGNIPDVNCFVDYIKEDSISLEIENKLGENIGINLDLKTCSPKFQDNITNNEKKNFIFFCNNYDYFNEEIIITYILKENGTVNVGGFINGPVV